MRCGLSFLTAGMAWIGLYSYWGFRMKILQKSFGFGKGGVLVLGICFLWVAAIFLQTLYDF